jgi:hypothetical protein
MVGGQDSKLGVLLRVSKYTFSNELLVVSTTVPRPVRPRGRRNRHPAVTARFLPGARFPATSRRVRWASCARAGFRLHGRSRGRRVVCTCCWRFARSARS